LLNFSILILIQLSGLDQSQKHILDLDYQSCFFNFIQIQKKSELKAIGPTPTSKPSFLIQKLSLITTIV